MRSSRRWTLLALYGALSAVYCAPLFEFPHGLGVYDWDQHLFYYGSVLKSVVEYAQPPFWNPWYCGGGVLWQNPQTPLLSPAYPLALILPLPLAMKVNIVLHCWLGFVGMHLLLTRAVGLRFLPGIVYLASVFVFSGAPAIHLLAGHSNFLPMFYLPFALLFAYRAITEHRLRDAGLAALPLALALLNGGPHVVPIAVMGLGVFALGAAAARRDWRPLVVVSAIVLGGFSLAAPKLLPTVLFVQSDHYREGRSIQQQEVLTPEMLLRIYLDPYQHPGLRVGPVRHGWWEYGNYIGSLSVLLTIASILLLAWSRTQPEWWLGVSLGLSTVALLVMSAGEFSEFAPYVLLKKLPLWSSFNVPSRYTLAVPLFSAATIGWMAQSVSREFVTSRHVRVMVAIVCVFASADLLARNRTQFYKVFSLPPNSTRLAPLQGPKAVTVDTHTNAQAANQSPMYRALMDNRPLSDCHEGVQVARTALPDAPLISAADGATVFPGPFSPNRFDFGVAVGPTASRVVLNQNFAHGWRSTAGPVVPDPASGRPSVVLPPGTTGQFAFRFVPPGLWSGFAIALAAAALAATGWRRRLPARRTRPESTAHV